MRTDIIRAGDAGSRAHPSPTLSEIRKWYWKERLPFIEMTAGIRGHSGAYRQTGVLTEQQHASVGFMGWDRPALGCGDRRAPADETHASM